MWFQTEKKKRNAAFEVKRAEHVPTLLGFWVTQTQSSSNTSDLKWKHERARRGSHRHMCLKCFEVRYDCKCEKNSNGSRPKGIEVCCCSSCGRPGASARSKAPCECA